MSLLTGALEKAVSALAIDGVKRAYGAVRHARKRRTAINRVLDQDAEQPDPNSQKAIGDLAQVIGSARGELTEEVAELLREIGRTAIPETILRCTFAGQDPTAVRPAFELVFQPYADLVPFAGEAFFNALVEAIKLRAESQVKDSGLLDFIQAQNKALSQQLSEILKSFEIIRPTISGGDKSSISESRFKIAKVIETANRTVSVETLQGIKRCTVRQLVVPARLSIVHTSDGAISENDQFDDPDISFQTFRSTFSRAVILGDPGGGKSTLTQLLCHELAYTIGLTSAHPDKYDLERDRLRLPLRVILRSFDKRRQMSPGYSFLDYFADEFKLVFDGSDERARAALSYFLATGSAIIIFDGLDEILDIDPRREIVTFIEQFCEVFAACPALVTSRFVGYKDAPMSDDFVPYELARFNAQEIQLFAERLIKQVAKLKKDKAKVEAIVFLRQTANIGNDLGQNPLMLGLMVYIFSYRGDVPSNRPEIYKECATLMFEKWDQRRDIIFDIPTDFDLLDLFAYLASRIFGSAETEDGVSREWLLAELRKFFESWYLEKPKALRVARSLVTFITGRAWIMCEIGPRVFKFTHRTFLEYFFARHLISSSEGVSDLIKTRLYTRILKSEWDVIVHLALHAAVFREGGKMQQAANTMLGLLDGVALPPAEEIAFASFVSKSLDYLMLPEQAYINIVKRLCAISLNIGATSSVGAVEIIDALIVACRKRDSLARPIVFDCFRIGLKSDDIGIRTFAAYTVSGKRDAEVYVRIRTGVTAERSPEFGPYRYFADLKQELRSAMAERADKNIVDARLFIAIYRSSRVALLEKHGVGAIIGDGPALAANHLNDLLLDILEEAMHWFRRNRGSASQTKTEAWDVVRYVARAARSGTACDLPTVNHLPSGAPERVIEAMHSFYRLTLGARTQTVSKDDLADGLLTIAFVTDVCAPLRQMGSRRANREGGASRFSRVLPREAYGAMLDSLSESASHDALVRWNDGALKFG